MEETTITEDKIYDFIALWEHQLMLCEPSDPSDRNRNHKKKNGMRFCSKNTEDLGEDSLLF